MRVIDILEAQANLEKLIDNLKPGESFIISKGGIERVRVCALTEEEIKNLTGEREASSRNARG